MNITRRLLSGLTAAGLVVLSLAAAAPAGASSSVSVSVTGIANFQFLQTCESASACNTVSPTQMDVVFQLSRELPGAITIDYKVVNGTAVNGVDFRTPATGSVTIPAHTFQGNLEVPLINEGEFGTTKTFTVQLTGASRPAALGAPGTGIIYGGNVATDCSFAYAGTESLALTCDGRPANLAPQLLLRIHEGPPEHQRRQRRHRRRHLNRSLLIGPQLRRGLPDHQFLSRSASLRPGADTSTGTPAAVAYAGRRA